MFGGIHQLHQECCDPGFVWLARRLTKKAGKRKPYKKAARLLQGLKVTGDGVLHAAVGRKTEKVYILTLSQNLQ